MTELIASLLPRGLVLAVFNRVVNHCLNSDDEEVILDARLTKNCRAQWIRVIDGEVPENR